MAERNSPTLPLGRSVRAQVDAVLSAEALSRLVQVIILQLAPQWLTS